MDNNLYICSVRDEGGRKKEEGWLAKYNEVNAFIEKEHRNPSRYDPEERFKYYN